MRKTLEKILSETILFEYILPNYEHNIPKSPISTEGDCCFININENLNLAKVIYNGIVEFAYDEFNINYDNLEIEQKKAIASRIRYDRSSTKEEKLKYGFFGEVLLDLILRSYMNTKVLLARGYFYSILENSEPKGYDAFHIMGDDESAELWFGEAKFYENYKSAITSVLKKIQISLSDNYLDKNIIAIINHRSDIKVENIKINNLFDDWEENPCISLSKEIKSKGITFVYPILIVYQKKENNYLDDIKNCIEHISSECKRIKIEINKFFDCKIFFAFLPVENVNEIKEAVINWIDSNEPLML